MKTGPIIGVVVVVIIVVVAVIILFHPGTIGATTVSVTAVDLSIDYQGISSGYLGPTSQSLSGFTATIGQSASYSITFTSTALLLSHSVTSIFVSTSGFSVNSISPNLPYSFSAGSTFTVTIDFHVPSSSYSGVLQLTLDTT